MSVNAIIDNEWVKCGNCGHKLMRLRGSCVCDHAPTIEIKCHSCKTINDFGVAGDSWKNSFRRREYIE